MKQAGLHRVDRTAHDCRNLLAGITELIAELNGEPLLDRELTEGLDEPVP
jgi:hypothetical protein